MFFQKLFTPYKINQCEIKNRFVVPAMVTNLCDEDGNITEAFIKYHEAKARGGFGLIITEDYGVNPHGVGYKNCIRLYDDSQVPANRRLTDTVHMYGAKMFAQVFHPGRQTSSAVNGGVRPVASAKIPDAFNREIPHELTVPEIHELVGEFANTARLMKKSGFDGIELHLAHGYLLAGFLSTRQNRRTDEYGGCFENRIRIVEEIYHAMRAEVGDDFPLTARVSLTEDTVDGRQMQETMMIVKYLEKLGFNGLNLSNGEYTSYAPELISSTFTAKGYNVENAKRVHDFVNIPTIVANGINDPAMAETVLEQDACDFVGMARASLADPDMPRKAARGQLGNINYCIRCLQGCEGSLLEGNHVRCLVNPELGHETEYTFDEVTSPKSVLVIGGGPAGMEAAIAATRRGHSVTLWEQASELGGEFISAIYPPAKGEYANYLVFLKHQMTALNINVVLNQSANVDNVRAFGADKIIVATGGDPNKPNLKGIDAENIHFANDVLLGKEPIEGEIVVVGGGEVGTETAMYLADAERGHITILEMTDDIDAGLLRTVPTKRFFRDHEVTVVTHAKVKEFRDNEVIVDHRGVEEVISADQIVLAMGYHADNELLTALQAELSNVVAVGDVVEPTNALEASTSGFKAGYYA
ncbi:FAD-dependent oxidoreductase [Companilactobacillus insicii]|uniref:oxidoreductase n=1 Tax=Companilactobacillus insicii TaxID=1732567 RepID=UPI000F7A1F91|nr:FAD-dependent oxidoreductase [Companilactobacillus insicii]